MKFYNFSFLVFISFLGAQSFCSEGTQSSSWVTQIALQLANGTLGFDPFANLYESDEVDEEDVEIINEQKEEVFSIAKICNPSSQLMVLQPKVQKQLKCAKLTQSNYELQTQHELMQQYGYEEVEKEKYKLSQKEASIIAYMDAHKYTHVPCKINENKWQFIERHYIPELPSDCHGEACLYSNKIQDACRKFLRAQDQLK